MKDDQLIVQKIEKSTEMMLFEKREIQHLRKFVAASLLPITSSVLTGLGYKVPEEIATFSLMSNGMQLIITIDYLIDFLKTEKLRVAELEKDEKNILGLRRR